MASLHKKSRDSKNKQTKIERGKQKGTDTLIARKKKEKKKSINQLSPHDHNRDTEGEKIKRTINKRSKRKSLFILH